MSSDPWGKAIALIHKRRRKRYQEGKETGAAWLVECRDLWDAHKDDLGAYFVVCQGEAEVDELVARMDDHTVDRIVGIYSLSRTIEEQGPGYTRDEWLEGLR